MSENAGLVICWTCQNQYPDLLMHVHHRTPRAAGGGDELVNLVKICPTCHTCIHQAGTLFSKGKVAQAKDVLILFSKGNTLTNTRLLQLVTEESKAWNLGTESDEQMVTFTLPRGTYETLKAIATMHKRPGQRGGVGKLLKGIVETWLKTYLGTQKR